VVFPKGIENIQKAAEVLKEFESEVIVGSVTSSSAGFPGKETEISRDAKVSPILEHIVGLVRCLMNLAPNLCDPFPVDTYYSDAKPTDADEDIQLAKILFPTATKSLVHRLGWANCRRRKYLQALQEKTQQMSFGGQNMSNFRRARKSPVRDVAVDAFNFQKPGQIEDKPMPPSKPRFRPTASYFAPSAPSEAGASSIVDSVFSHPTANLASAAGTSIPDVEAVFKPRTVPRPPVALESGRRFLCPYCHDELEVDINITTKDDWDVHVFADLEPYMCTFDKCLRAEKTFAGRDDWFRHELESHRILKVWVCHSCVKEFSSAQAFEEHLQMKHNNISGPSQMAMMVALCVKHSEIHLKEEVCPLCALKLTVEAMRDHIASHLEQYALTSINGDESSEEDDSDEIQSVRFDDNESVVGRTKLEILNDFVEEQLGFVLPDKKVVADTNMDESVLDFVLDSDEEDVEDEEGRLGSARKRRGEEARDWKLGNYLESHVGKRAVVNNDRTRFSKSPLQGGVDARMQNLHLASSSTSARTTNRTQPHPRDDDFVGRDGDLATMYRILSTAGRICTICGTGGIGKTATAIEYDHRYENAYTYIFWIQAETHVGTADTFSLIAMALGLAPDGEDQKQLIELGREFLEQTEKRWLLIFDNVNEWADIEAYIPVNMPLTQGSVLITTRIAELEPTPIPTNYFRINLKEMTPEELQSLLIQSLQPSLKHEKVRFHPEWKTAGEIASLAGLPLAISQIVGYVKTSGCTLAEFLELWNEWWKNSLTSRPSGVSSNAALEAIWDIGLNELGKDALKLLKILAFVDSDGIQKELLMNDHTFLGLVFLKSSTQVR
jgi:NB-ARC domain